MKFNKNKSIIFPEEPPIKENKEQNEMLLLLEKDDIYGFISFLSSNHVTFRLKSPSNQPCYLFTVAIV